MLLPLRVSQGYKRQLINLSQGLKYHIYYFSKHMNHLLIFYLNQITDNLFLRKWVYDRYNIGNRLEKCFVILPAAKIFLSKCI